MNEDIPRPLILRLSAREQILFSKRLAMVLRSGAPIRQALLMVEPKAGSGSARYVIGSIIRDISSGMTLAQALTPFESIFGAFSIGMVKVGEASGTLHHNLEYLAEELKKKNSLRKKVIGSLMYPAIIVCATVCMSLALTVYIFPKILPIFKDFKHALPLSTRLLIAFSNFLSRDWSWAFAALLILGAALHLLSRTAAGKRSLDSLLLALPIFGGMARSYHLATIARTLGLLLKGEVRIVPALEVVAEICSNSIYKERMRAAATSVGNGKRLSAEFGSSPDLFPQLMSQMVAAGEQTGDLAGALMYISETYEEEIDDLTKNLSTLLEPLLMLLMGAAVGFIAVSIITPIYGITQDLTLH